MIEIIRKTNFKTKSDNTKFNRFLENIKKDVEGLRLADEFSEWINIEIKVRRG